MRPIPALIHVAFLLGVPGRELKAQSPPCPAGTSIINYRADAIDNGFSTIVGLPGTVNVFVTPNDDAVTAAIPVPAGFAFNYYGVAKTNFKICTNGIIVFWVNLYDPNTLIIGPLPTNSGGCVHLDFPLPLGLTGVVVDAQWGAVLASGGLVSLIQLTEGAKIVIS